jgi:hypothetical protein
MWSALHYRISVKRYLCAFVYKNTVIKNQGHLLSSRHQVFPPEVKRISREADHWPPSSDEVKNARSHSSAEPYGITVLRLIKHRDNLTSTFTFTSASNWRTPFNSCIVCVWERETSFTLRGEHRLSWNKVLRKVFGPERQSNRLR